MVSSIVSKIPTGLLTSYSSSIVDFEDCRIVDDAVEESPDFKDAEFRYWNLDEETVSRHRVANLGLDND
jgi:hypothetical protein